MMFLLLHSAGRQRVSAPWETSDCPTARAVPGTSSISYGLPLLRPGQFSSCSSMKQSSVMLLDLSSFEVVAGFKIRDQYFKKGKELA